LSKARRALLNVWYLHGHENVSPGALFKSDSQPLTSVTGVPFFFAPQGLEESVRNEYTHLAFWSSFVFFLISFFGTAGCLASICGLTYETGPKV